MTFTWQGRRLATASANGKSLSFKYNADGIRTQKTVNGVTTYFTLDGSKIISQKKGNQEIFFEYDAQGNVATMIYNGSTYYYVRNLTGEILGLTDSSGNMIVEYLYDPWGKLLDYSNTGNFDLANLNPFKYKDYYYDSELGFYYLNSRYYDPEICRFINADSVDVATATPMALTDKNLFAYCDNNPIIRADNGGEAWHILAGAAIGGVSSFIATLITERSLKEAFISMGFGAASGALTAACPSAGLLIDVGLGFAEEVTVNWTSKDNFKKKAINTSISMGADALASLSSE